MKNTIVVLLVATLLLGISNLLVSLGFFGEGGAVGGAVGKTPVVYEYKALEAQQIDSVGFRAVALEEGIEIGDTGEINFPEELLEKIVKVNLLPRSIVEVEKDGGWEFVAATGDNHYLFRRVR